MKFYSVFINFHSKKIIRKCRLQTGDRFSRLRCVNSIADDVLVTQAGKASVASVLAKLSQNILISAHEGYYIEAWSTLPPFSRHNFQIHLRVRKFCEFFQFSLKLVSNDPISNNPASVQITAWRRPGDIMISTLLKLICATGPRLLKHSLTEDKINMHSQYHGYWWPGYLHRQSINSHGIDLVIPEYCGCSTRILTHRGWDRITDSLQQAFLITFFEWIHLYFDSNFF